ncbi:Apolipoprotein N-acyltransferase [Kingella potus]|uniref:Apolipoprotein N-acyltransferase n=1 Tax=Kingella potus TaxID=265175 RepID=A0A377R306_9NEIS|nr:apolipoprotein N-acyltransferase [Kingella potus]STR03318.1 Apolipoprotein N-acyltransferase [Kingella potus]
MAEIFSKLENLWRKPAVYWPLLPVLAAATPLAFAPYYRFWLMPLLFAAFVRLLELRPEVRVRSAYLFALAAYTCQFYWIHTALHDVSGLPNVYALPLTALLPAYLALYPAAAVWLWGKTRLNRWLAVGFALPVFWTLAEFARERLLTGFGWGALGYSQIADASPLAGFAPIGGIHLVTFATALAGAWLVLVVDSTGRLKTRAAFACGLAALLFAGHTARQAVFTQPTGAKAAVALAQGNIPQTLKFREDQVLPTLQRYYAQIAESAADIVILPETAIPVILQQLPDSVLEEFAAAARQNGSALAVGVIRYTDDGTGYQNAVINLTEHRSGSSHKLPFYAKNHLVPFGEYKPLPALTTGLYTMMDMPLADFRRGGGSQTPLRMKNQKIAFNICYEDGFGDELIAAAAESTLLANASNLAWYGKSNAMYQHVQQSQARALELGRPMVRATNTGATAFIDHQGRITAQLPADTAAVLTGTVEGRSGQTPYMKLGGSWPLIGLLALTAAALLAAGRRKKAV